MPEIKQIVYISGSGRSGSTLLERLMHSSPDVAALGEFHCLWRLPEHEINCSCGSGFGTDPFWRAIKDRASITSDVIAELGELEDRVCRTGFLLRHRFNKSSISADTDVKRFLALQLRIFQAVAQETGRSVIIDSSKAGPRAWLLSCLPHVKVIHLYRDPADVIASWRQAKFDPGMGRAMKRMSISAAALDWWKVEQLARLLGGKTPVHRIDYSAFCAAPRPEMEAAYAALGIGATRPPHWLSDTSVEQGKDYHSLNGNPDRFDKGPIRVALRQADWKKLGRSEERTIKAVASALRTLWPNLTRTNP